MNITFTTELPIEAIDNGYYTIATNGKVGQQHINFYGSLDQAVQWFFNTISEAYQNKISFQEKPIELGETSYKYDVYTDVLVFVDTSENNDEEE